MIKKIINQSCITVFLLYFFTAAYAVPTADEIVRADVAAVQSSISLNRTRYESDNDAFYQMVDTKLAPDFDSRYVMQLVLGRALKQATPEQREGFETVFRNMLIRFCADTFLKYSDGALADVQLGSLSSDAITATVITHLRRRGAQSMPFVFSLRLVNDVWKVYDIQIENISWLTNLRSQVKTQLSTLTLGDLLAKLEQDSSSIKQPAIERNSLPDTASNATSNVQAALEAEIVRVETGPGPCHVTGAHLVKFLPPPFLNIPDQQGVDTIEDTRREIINSDYIYIMNHPQAYTQKEAIAVFLKNSKSYREQSYETLRRIRQYQPGSVVPSDSQLLPNMLKGQYSNISCGQPNKGSDVLCEPVSQQMISLKLKFIAAEMACHNRAGTWPKESIAK